MTERQTQCAGRYQHRPRGDHEVEHGAEPREQHHGQQDPDPVDDGREPVPFQRAARWRGVAVQQRGCVAAYRHIAPMIISIIPAVKP